MSAYDVAERRQVIDLRHLFRGHQGRRRRRQARGERECCDQT
jgi:hypothetical protein